MAVGSLGLLTLTFAGCSSSESPAWATDACNIHASWVGSGRPESDEERVTARLVDALPTDAAGSVADAVQAFVDEVRSGDRAFVSSASESVRQSCEEVGWEPAEG